MLTIDTELLARTKARSLGRARDQYDHRGVHDVEAVIQDSTLDDEALAELRQLGTESKDTKLVRAIDAIAHARSGKFDKAVPSFKAFESVLRAYLASDRIDGWIYVEAQDGKLYPELVTNVEVADTDRYRRSRPQVVISTTAYGVDVDDGRNRTMRVRTNRHTFEAASVANRKIADILAASGIYHETHALKSAYEASVERYRESVQDAFAGQFQTAGRAYAHEEDNWHRREESIAGRRVIHDLANGDFGPRPTHAEVEFAAGREGGIAPLPQHPVVRVFDLKSHEYLWVHADNLQPHEYDKALRDRLVLPDTHRDLLDILTSNIEAFTGDLIEGKTAGNVILCKGKPGVGKTLTAEVYAEITGRPLYRIHSGSLGTSAERIADNLQEVFKRVKRWGCVLLLDEADIFVAERGDDIELNAIVAEFLRVLEYFDGLLFMTTNRPQDIDQAIVNRCIAVIDYEPPGPRDRAQVWRVMSELYKADLGDGLIADLVELFPDIVPRDIKMLTSLVMRVAAAGKAQVDLDTFRRCAMFRAVRIAETSAVPGRA